MQNLSEKISNYRIISISIFLFFSLALTIPSGYSYSAALLLILSIVSLRHIPSAQVDQHTKHSDRVLIYILSAIFLISTIMTLLHREPLSTLDQASRYLLVIPILLLLRKSPPDIRLMWAGLIIGVLCAAGIAYWQVNILRIGRATGFVTSAIPFGGIALSMGTICLAGLPWASTQGRFKTLWGFALSLGFCAGIYCSIVSGSRGTWIALLPLSILFIISFSGHLRGYQSITIALIIVGAMATLFFTNNTIQNRYTTASQQFNHYLDERNSNSSVGERLEAWRTALINIRQKPVIGWSQDAYRRQIEGQASRGEISSSVPTLANSHNNYLEVLVFQGLAGLTALLSLFLYTFYVFAKRIRDRDPRIRSIGLAGASLVISFFSFGLTQVILGRNNGVMFFLLTLTIMWTSMIHCKDTGQHPASPTNP